MKRITLFFYLFLFFANHSIAQDKLLDGIAAIVDEEIILHSELTQFTIQLALQLKIDLQKEPEKIDELRRATLENLITQKVLLSKAKEDTVIVEEQQVEEILNNQIQQWTQQLGSISKVEEYFDMPIGKIKRQFQEDVRNRLMVERTQQMFVQTITITRQEVERFFRTMQDSLPEINEMVHIRVLLREVRAGGKGKEEAFKKISEIRDRIVNGEDFATLAKENSEDPGSVSAGGELGLIQRGDFVHEFEETAFKLKPGDISEIIETKFGLHIIKLIEKRGERINVRHILIQLKAGSSDAEKTRAFLAAIKDSIQTEDDFIKMAEKYSHDATSNDNGGDLGWFEVEGLQIPEFKKALEGLEIGEVSQPFLTEFGYFIIRLDEKREGGKLNLEDDWQQLEQFALKQKSSKKMQEWVEDLKTKIYIELKERVN